MKGTRWRHTFRATLATIHREIRITLTPVPRPEMWAFVVGCYNSGTELCMHLLGSHPQISALPVEGQFLTDQLVSDYELGLPRMWVLREELFRLTEEDEGPDPIRLKKEWGQRLDTRRPVLLEKSPPNAARTRWLQAHFAPARFIAVVRNGYAVAEGIRRKARPKHRASGWPIDLCARQWSRSNEILLEDSEHLEHVLWLRYEDLARDPAAEVARIADFLKLDEGASAMNLEGSWSVHERNEPIRDLTQESIARLDSSDIRIINREAGAMLERLGYALL